MTVTDSQNNRTASTAMKQATNNPHTKSKQVTIAHSSNQCKSRQHIPSPLSKNLLQFKYSAVFPRDDVVSVGIAVLTLKVQLAEIAQRKTWMVNRPPGVH